PSRSHATRRCAAMCLVAWLSETRSLGNLSADAASEPAAAVVVVVFFPSPDVLRYSWPRTFLDVYGRGQMSGIQPCNSP
ncbi:unnamed protein product, partial [Mycena citricolor]